jgi:hypothetical protein
MNLMKAGISNPSLMVRTTNAICQWVRESVHCRRARLTVGPHQESSDPRRTGDVRNSSA